MLRLRIRRFSFGLVVNLSPKYSFFLGFLKTFEGGLNSVFINCEDTLLMGRSVFSAFKTETSHLSLFGFGG